MKQLLLALIRMYQKHVSPAFPPRCRFIPTCSQYAAEAISKYGALRGGLLAQFHKPVPQPHHIRS